VIKVVRIYEDKLPQESFVDFYHRGHKDFHRGLLSLEGVYN